MVGDGTAAINASTEAGARLVMNRGWRSGSSDSSHPWILDRLHIRVQALATVRSALQRRSPPLAYFAFEPVQSRALPGALRV
jgi:hypothetical protein